MKVNLALIQMEPRHGDLEYNRRSAEKWIRAAMQKTPRPDLLILPENWTSVFGEGDEQQQAREVREPVTGESVQLLRSLAKEYGVWIAGGTITMQSETEPDKNYNALLLIDREGNIKACYNKIHLCSWVGEQEAYAHGDEITMVETEIGKLGLCVCYDIRFPELVRIHALNGVQLLVVPACFGTYLSHWQNLIRARAMENQIFVAGCGCCGNGGTRYRFVGHSMVAAPNGEILAEAGEEEEILSVSLDLDQIAQVRDTVKYLNDRRPEVYRKYSPQ